MNRISRISGGFVLAVVLGSSLVSAQQSKFYSNIDYPSPGLTIRQSTIEATGGIIAAGWAFDCSTGVHPVFAVPVLLNLDTNRVWQPDFWFQKDHLFRPDVFNAFRAACPKVNQYEGYSLHVSPVPPVGRYRVWIFWGTNAESRDIQVIGG